MHHCLSQLCDGVVTYAACERRPQRRPGSQIAQCCAAPKRLHLCVLFSGDGKHEVDKRWLCATNLPKPRLNNEGRCICLPAE